MEMEKEYRTIDLRGSLAFLFVHAGCLLVFWTGVSWVAIGAMVFFYVVRAFGLTAGYHRYFSHRSFKTSRVFQFILGFIGASAGQLGPLWWAAHHREHHRFADTKDDIHSPVIDGFWWSHVGWILCAKFIETREDKIKDFAKYPELRFLNRYHFIAPWILVFILSGIGWYLQVYVPQWGATPLQMVAWGFFVGTVLLYHATFFTNSLAHVWGSRRFNTKDHSRNNWFVSLLTLGEGWHNNHHRFPASERQGFYWWEIDVTHYGLKLFSFLGIVKDLVKPPQSIYDEAKQVSAKV